jgi:hypothetical protein
MNEMTGGWMKLNSEKLHNLYSSPNAKRVINTRKVSWKGNVACMGEKYIRKYIRNTVLAGQPKGKKTEGIHQKQTGGK